MLPSFQGASEAPISGFIRVDPPRRRKNGQLAAARRVALKMGRRLRCSSVTSRTSVTLLAIWLGSATVKLVRDALAGGPF
jgi:hypothetical protein